MSDTEACDDPNCWCKPMQTITVLVNDTYPGTPNPLIYTVQVKDVTDGEEIANAIYTERLADIGELPAGDELELELLVAFAGDLHPVADWRG